MSEQLARGTFAGFGAPENPFGVPNGMEDNLRLQDDHMGLYTVLPPVAVGTPLPANPADGDGQAFVDGTYAVFNGGTWKTYPVRKGIKVVLATGTDAWFSTGTGWQSYVAVAVAAASQAAVPAATAAAEQLLAATQLQAAAAQNSAAMANAAAASSLTNGQTYGDVNLGMASTTADGQFFDVVGDNISTATVRYQRLTSTTYKVASVTPAKALVDGLTQVLNSKRFVRNGKWITGFTAVDPNGKTRVLSGHTLDGKFQIGTVADIGGKIATQMSTFFALNKRSGYYWGARDAVRRRIIGVGTNMHLYVGNVDHSAAISNLTSALTYLPMSTAIVDAWGDSLTYGVNGSSAAKSWPSQFAALTGLTVNNLGVPGQDSTGIAQRCGASPILLTLTGNVIPASGSVAVTPTNAAAFTGYVGIALPGRIGTIAGSLVRNNTTPTTYTFTRTTAGVAVPTPPNSAFIADGVGQGKNARVIWVGRNDINGNEAATIAPAQAQAMVAQMVPVNKRFAVLSVLNGAGEGAGTAKYTMMQSINAAYQAAWPGNYIDVRGLLMLANDGSAQDLADVAADIVPTSLRTTAGVVDTQHLNDTGYQVVANAVSNLFTSKGWLS